MSLARRGNLLAIYQALNAAGGLALAAALLRILGVEAYGLYALGLAVAGLASCLVWEVELISVRFASLYLAQGRGKAMRRLVAIVAGTAGLQGAAVGVLIAASAGPVARFYEAPGLAPVLRCAAFLPLCLAMVQATGGFLLALRNMRTLLGLGVLRFVLRGAAAAWVLVRAPGPAEAAAVVVAADLVHALASLGAVLAGLRGLPLEDERRSWRRVLLDLNAYAWPVYLARFTHLASVHGSKAVLGVIAGPSAVGIYSLAKELVERAAELGGSWSKVLLSDITALDAPNLGATSLGVGERSQRLAGASRALLTASAAGTGFLVLFAPEIVRILGGPGCALAAPVLTVLALSLPFRLGTQALSGHYFARSRTGVVLAVNAGRLLIEALAFGLLLWVLPAGAASHGAAIAQTAACVAAWCGVLYLLVSDGALSATAASRLGRISAASAAVPLAVRLWAGSPGPAQLALTALIAAAALLAIVIHARPAQSSSPGSGS